MITHPSSKAYLGRSPEGTAMRSALSRAHIAARAGLGRPGARPEGNALRFGA